MKMNGIIEVVAYDNHTMSEVFDDDTNKTIVVKLIFKSGVFLALRDLNYFREVILQNGFIYWDNGFDFYPNFLYGYTS